MFPIMVIKPTRSVRVCKRERETETESLGGWVMGGVKLFSCHQTRVFVPDWMLGGSLVIAGRRQGYLSRCRVFLTGEWGGWMGNKQLVG